VLAGRIQRRNLRNAEYSQSLGASGTLACGVLGGSEAFAGGFGALDFFFGAIFVVKGFDKVPEECQPRQGEQYQGPQRANVNSNLFAFGGTGPIGSGNCYLKR